MHFFRNGSCYSPQTRVVDAIVARSVERKQPSHDPGSSTSRMTTAGSMIGDKPGKHWWRPTFLLSLLSNAGAPSSPLCCSNRVSLHARISPRARGAPSRRLRPQLTCNSPSKASILRRFNAPRLLK